MTVHYEDGTATVHHGDCLEVLRGLPDASVDSVVTDPPYGLANTTPELVGRTLSAWLSGDREFIPDGKGFMGRAWDGFVPPVAVWDECLRVLKPGGHLLAFAGSRTLDLMGIAVRLAGFEVRDSLAWLYGSGFPKSRDVSESMERYLSGEGPAAVPGRVHDPGIYEVTAYLRDARDRAGWSNRQIDELFGTNGMAGHWVSQASQPAVPSLRQWAVLKERLGTLGDDVDELVERFASNERPEDWGTRESGEAFLESLRKDGEHESAGGWGTALKPALEPVVFARKPVIGSTTANVAAYGTGALNIDASRVGDGGLLKWERPRGIGYMGGGTDSGTVAATENDKGRWPANLLLDGYAADELDRQAPGERPGRFFPTFRYEAKAPTHERPVVDGVSHPTVKPLELMRWLVRLVTPPGGTVLEPFAGSGTTVEAAVLEGFDCVAVEREAEYLPLITSRLSKPLTPALDLGSLGGGGLW
ncbi:DNA methyltransferase [Georgenia sp. MJ170]|uniref:DNA methyltransferase n=1 Tax=Georgenia sunbinii TaxID=3117728 RepID=UPI002F2671B6